MELIKHAAIKSAKGHISRGKTHQDCFSKCVDMGEQPSISMSPDNQGFITSIGRYVTRVEAAEIAFISGQIDKDTDFLFSEDMWSKEYSGEHHYSEIEGYYIPRERDENTN